MATENIPSRLHCVAEGNVLTGANEILDDGNGKKQNVINQENDQRLETLEAAVGTGGSVDSRIESAKTEIVGGASSDCNTLGKAEVLISTNANDIAALQEAYAALTQNDVVVVAPADTWPVATPAQNTIYRVVDRTNTPPQYYTDYMWNGTAMVEMAKYNNAIDARPKKASQNLVTSGGVFDNMGALDVSELNATENPHTLAKYVDLSAALAAVPTDYQKGGMSIKFVQSSDNKYVQARLMADSFTTDVTQWQTVDSEPVDCSKNLVESGGVLREISKLSQKVGTTPILTTGFEGLIPLNGGIGTVAPVNNPDPSAAMRYMIQPCTEGDEIIVKGTGGNTGRLWGFLDSSYKILSVAAASTSATNLKLNAPSNAAYIVINDNSSSTSYILKASSIEVTKADKEDVAVIENKVKRINQELGNEVDFPFDGYIDENGEYHNDNDEKCTDYIKVNANDIVVFSGFSPFAQNMGMMWGYSDNSGNTPIMLLQGNATYIEQEVSIPVGVNYIRAWVKSSNPYSLKVEGIVDKVKILENEFDQTYDFLFDGYLNTNGEFVADDGEKCTDYIEVSDGDVVLYTGRNGYESIPTVVYAYLNKTSPDCISLLSGLDTFTDVKIVIPPGFKYIRAWSVSNHDAVYGLEKVGKTSGKIKLLQDEVTELSHKSNRKKQLLYETPLDSQLSAFSSILGNKSAWNYANGIVSNSSYGVNNRLLLSQRFSMDSRTMVMDFAVASNCELFFGYERESSSNRDLARAADGNTLFSVDFGNKTLNYYGLFSKTDMTIKSSENFVVDNYTSKIFRIECIYFHRGVTAKLYDLTDYTLLAEISSANGEEQVLFVGYDQYFVWTANSAVSFNKLLVKTTNYIGECKALIFGDSITYGQGCPDYLDTWSYKLAQQLGNSFVCAISGGKVEDVFEQLETTIGTQVPLYSIFCIGANNGISKAQAISLVNTAKSYGSIPILCTTPEFVNTEIYDVFNTNIIDAANECNVNVVRFDIATSINYDTSNGQDSSLFISDRIHPNPAGNQRMLNRFKIDVPELL